MMQQKNNHGSIAFLSTYPPRECGIATFTQDMVIAMDIRNTTQTGIIAITNNESDVYDDKVITKIRQNHREDYMKAAHCINDSEFDLVVIEHEFGVFGGDHGDYVIDFVDSLDVPVVTTLHTILPEPDEKQRFIIHSLGKKSAKVVTMAKNTMQLLQSVYGIDPCKIEVIHHGVPKRLIQSRELLKKKFGYVGRQIVSTFGLLGPGKGIEHGIEAISKVAKDQKDVLYLILGQTHPALKEEGQAYRSKLERLVEELELSRNVLFVNKYLTKDEIIQYLQLSDIYMTPYMGKDQAVSGTMAYAAGYGRVIVSTPFLYAKEMLSEGRGMLAEFNNPDSLAECINVILHNPAQKARMEREVIRMGRTMYWDRIAQLYTEVFIGIINATPQIGVV